MLYRQIDAQELYVRIGHHIEAMPARIELHSAEKEIWVSQAVALVEAVGNIKDTLAIRDAAEWYSAHPNIYANSFWLILQRALARAELAAPASSSGSFLPVGSAMDAMTAIGKVLKEARAKLLVVDPYLDETILTDFAPMSMEGVKLELLCDGATVKANLAPAVKRWTAQYAAKRPIEARSAGPRLLHDRLIVVDDTKGWTVSQSFKDLAARSPASITVTPPEVAKLKISAYADLWAGAIPL
ncbi:phosphatidylserine/phosphatidylglycerophosphate/cardiolipin synthase family protein [Mesorhizobium sp. f-mel]